MKTRLAPRLFAAIVVLLAGSAYTRPAAAANTAPAIDAFNTMFATVHDYTYKLHSHEVLGSASQNRVYIYSFMKPHYAKTLIESGDGAGSGGVWTGGTQVSGHQGGILSGIHLKVDLHDHRAVSLRGYTIPDGLLQNEVATYADIPGTLTEVAGGVINGIPTERLELKVGDPAANSGITRQIMYLSQATHWPVREIMFVGDQVVLDQSVSDLKVNPGLTENDFPF
jgi:hypothetical protein